MSETLLILALTYDHDREMRPPFGNNLVPLQGWTCQSELGKFCPFCAHLVGEVGNANTVRHGRCSSSHG